MTNDRRVKTAWKYKLEVADNQEIEVPYGSLYLSCACQNNDVVLWFLVDPYTDLREKWQVFIRGTGHLIGEERLRVAMFAGTVLMMDGSLVWHIWLSKIE